MEVNYYKNQILISPPSGDCGGGAQMSILNGNYFIARAFEPDRDGWNQ